MKSAQKNKIKFQIKIFVTAMKIWTKIHKFKIIYKEKDLIPFKIRMKIQIKIKMTYLTKKLSI